MPEEPDVTGELCFREVRGSACGSEGPFIMKVLLVDDDITVRSALRRCFATEGWTVDIAADENSTTGRFRDGTYDIVVVTYTMALGAPASGDAGNASSRVPRDVPVERSASKRPSLEALDVLTPRQVEVLECLDRGMANKEIAVTLGFSVKSAEYHVGQILRKTGCSSRSELLVRNRGPKAHYEGRGAK